MNRWSRSAIVAAAMPLVVAPHVMAGPVSTVQWDVNTLIASATGGELDSDFTGTLTLSSGLDTELRDILVNDVSDGAFVVPEAVSVLGVLNFLNGTIAAGSFMSISVDNDGMGGFDDSFTSIVVAGTGGIITDFGDPTRLILGAMIEQISLSQDDGSTFSNVPMPDFFPLGSFIEFKLNKALINTDGRIDQTTDVDLFGFVMLPVPSAAGLGSLGLLAVLARRSRRTA